MENYKCVVEFFKWGRKNKLSWVRVTSPTGKGILVNLYYKRKQELSQRDVSFLKGISTGREWPEKNIKTFSIEVMKRFLEIAEKEKEND